jgi:hypothetical protein
VKVVFKKGDLIKYTEDNRNRNIFYIYLEDFRDCWGVLCIKVYNINISMIQRYYYVSDYNSNRARWENM